MFQDSERQNRNRFLPEEEEVDRAHDERETVVLVMKDETAMLVLSPLERT